MPNKRFICKALTINYTNMACKATVLIISSTSITLVFTLCSFPAFFFLQTFLIFFLLFFIPSSPYTYMYLQKSSNPFCFHFSFHKPHQFSTSYFSFFTFPLPSNLFLTKFFFLQAFIIQNVNSYIICKRNIQITNNKHFMMNFPKATKIFGLSIRNKFTC